MGKWTKTNYPGVRYRKHPTRRHGVGPDKYYSIYYKVDGKQREEGLGWASEGWTLEKAAETRTNLRKAYRQGSGPRTLAEAREVEKAEREAEQKVRARERKEGVPFVRYFNKTYSPEAELSKTEGTVRVERQHVRDWIEPAIGDKALKDIDSDDLSRIRLAMTKAGRAKRTIQHVFSTVRLVWNHARDRGLVSADCPTRNVKLGRIDNKRTRFLSADEVRSLLDTIQPRDPGAHGLTLAAVYTGARLGELSSLTWGNVNLADGTITLIHTKTGKPRTIPLAPALADVLRKRGPGKPSELVFTNQLGGRWTGQPAAFRKAVAALRFNEGRDDPRERVTFHTLRHTAASLMLASGVDVRTLQELFGWSTIQMLERYTHATSEAKARAVSGLGKTLSGDPGKVVPIRRTGSES